MLYNRKISYDFKNFDFSFDSGGQIDLEMKLTNIEGNEVEQQKWTPPDYVASICKLFVCSTIVKYSTISRILICRSIRAVK